MRHTIMTRISWLISFIVLAACAVFAYSVSSR
jgi:hypothetical protein